MITLIAVIMASSLFIFFRHQAAKRLESAYNHLEIANARAEESSRMKSNFIQQISHEIRTPLNVLSGFTQIITTPGMKLDDATLADINRQITENTDRITGLVNKMLELSDAGSRTIIERTDNIPVAQIAAEAAEISGINNAKHLTFDLQLAPDVETTQIQTNLRAAVRALSLVLDNARKFTAPAEARRHQATVEQQHVALVVSKEERQIKFAVEDSGPGIPVADAERIFDEFVQLDEYYDGTGIGLTIARSLTRRLGGELILDTTYQKGARFVLSLPCF
jgi:signal transduction histidine kinase